MTLKCVICNSKNLNNYTFIAQNRYTEEFSNLLKLSNEELERKYSNIICSDCGFIFKKKWFLKKHLKEIYTKLVPSHPRGWDTISKKFNIRYLERQFKLLEKYNENNKNVLKLNHIKRNIFGLLSSMQISNSQKKKLDRLVLSIKKNEIKKINYYKKKVNFYFKPKVFSRYAGFKDINLFNHINSKIGGIKKYGEIGCPLWGMIEMAKKKKCTTYFIRPETDVFWGLNCKLGKNSCISKLSNTKILNKINNLNKTKLDYIGVYNLLDHYSNPLKFLNRAFKFTRSIGIITEKTGKMPIQHHNLLSSKTIKKIALKCKKKIDSSFNKKIKDTEYNFYLLH